MNNLNINSQTEIDELKNDSTHRFMMEFLSLPHHRKIVILKTYIENSNGMSVSYLNKVLKNITNHFSLSIARNREKIAKLEKSRLGLNHRNNLPSHRSGNKVIKNNFIIR